MAENLDNRRLFLAALLSLAVLMVWQWLLPPKPPVEPLEASPISSPVSRAGSESPSEPSAQPGERPVAEDAATAKLGAASTQAPVERPLVVAESEQTVELATDGARVQFTNRGGQVFSFELLARGANGKSVELVRLRDEKAPYPFAWIAPDGSPVALNQELFVVERPSRRAVTFRYSGPLGAAEKTFELLDDGRLAVDASVTGGVADWGLLLGPGLRNPPLAEFQDRFQKKFRRASFGNGSAVDDLEAGKVDAPTEIAAGGLTWVGLEDKYFLTALVAESRFDRVMVRPVTNLTDETQVVGYQEPADAAAAKEDGEHDLELIMIGAGGRLAGVSYWGPKEYVELRRLGVGLENTVRWGMFGFIAKPLLYGLRWLFDHVVHNYGWCIVLMTFLIKVVLFPLTHKSYVSMQKLQKLNPQMEAIRARFRPKLRDPKGRPNIEMQRKMNEEIQALFKSEGASPAGGCLPMLVQMPIFFGFYQLLSQAVELWNAPWIWWIHDLTARDPYWVLPLIMGATQLAQTRMMPPATNPSQRIIMTTMPIWFTVLAFGFPSGLVLYWLTNNVLTIIQQGGYQRLKKAGFFGGEDVAPTAAKVNKKG